MLFGVAPGYGAHVENKAMVKSKYYESQKKLGSIVGWTAKRALWNGVSRLKTREHTTYSTGQQLSCQGEV